MNTASCPVQSGEFELKLLNTGIGFTTTVTVFDKVTVQLLIVISTNVITVFPVTPPILIVALPVASRVAVAVAPPLIV